MADGAWRGRRPRQVTKLGERLETKGLRLRLDDGAVDILAERGFDPAFGARPVKRAVQRFLESPLAKARLSRLQAAAPLLLPTGPFVGHSDPFGLGARQCARTQEIKKK